MIFLTERSFIPASPQVVWDFFADIEARYAEWHQEHISWRWLRGQPLEPDAIWFADEWVGPTRISSRFFIEDVQPPWGFRYRVGLPPALVGAGGSFQFNEAADGSCEYVQEIHFGYSLPLLGAASDLLLRLVLPLAEFRRHMREEQANLAAILAV